MKIREPISVQKCFGQGILNSGKQLRKKIKKLFSKSSRFYAIHFRIDRIYPAYKYTIFFKFLTGKNLRMPKIYLGSLKLRFSDNKIPLFKFYLSEYKRIIQYLHISGISAFVHKSQFT